MKKNNHKVNRRKRIKSNNKNGTKNKRNRKKNIQY